MKLGGNVKSSDKATSPPPQKKAFFGSWSYQKYIFETRLALSLGFWAWRTASAWFMADVFSKVFQSKNPKHFFFRQYGSVDSKCQLEPKVVGTTESAVF